MTVPLLAEYLGKDRSSVYENLYILGKQGFISKSYDSSYRLPGKSARYYLSSKGIRYLRENTDLNQTVLRNMYKNRTVSEEHVERCLMVIQIVMTIRRQTKDQFLIFTRHELADFDWMVRPFPDLYLQRKKPKQDQQNYYILDFFHKLMPFYLIKKRVWAHQEQDDEINFADNETYPDLLFIVLFKTTEERLCRVASNNSNHFEIYTTMLSRLLNPESKSSEIWRDVFEEDEFTKL